MKNIFKRTGRKNSVVKNTLFRYIFTILGFLFLTVSVLACRGTSAGKSGGGGSSERYAVNISIPGGLEDGNLVSVSPESGIHGDLITIDYVVAENGFYNRLDFSGIKEFIEPVESAEQGSRIYTLDLIDAVKGVITIIAEFTHTDLELDPIEFSVGGPAFNLIYGTDEVFVNEVKSGHSGWGEISYVSSDASVASVDSSTGEVSILKAGSTDISAIKEADAVYAQAVASYTLNVGLATLQAPLEPVFSGRTKFSITLSAPLDVDSRFALEYARSSIDAVPAGGWQDSVTFDGLDDQIGHYFFARYKYDPDKNKVSASSASLFAITDDGDGSLENPFKVHDVATLQRVGKGSGVHSEWNLSAHYKQLRDIDITGKSFSKIASYVTKDDKFLGSYNGFGKKITGLMIFASDNYHGMFGFIDVGAVVENLGLENVTISAGKYVGGIVGYSKGTVKNSYVTGSIIGKSDGVDLENSVGGIVGWNEGIIKNTYATAKVTGNGKYVGGIAGQNRTGAARIENSFAIGNVSGGDNVGGVVGINYIANGAMVKNSLALNKVVSVAAGKNELGRITGSSTNQLENNYAREDMTPSRIGNAKSREGLSITEAEYHSGIWWENTALFSADEWNIQSGKLPSLKIIDGVQNLELLP